ncbi:MAG: hypothetical protein HY896_09725 [Deltaproteobacteria bacterium]|nr:hypothetical protein [Deltaproteobacteria bacterium]
MRLRIILVVLSLLSFLSVSAAGYIYYSSLNESAVREAEKEIALQAERTGGSLSSFLSENLKTVKALAGMKELGRALVGGGRGNLDGANSVLDHFRDALKVDVCYLMDRNGDTVASSNRLAADSFVGRNFSFRPYWHQAIRGNPASYLALGVASNVRGVYSSHPVYRETGGAPVGVVVIKAPIERIEEEFRREFEGIVLLADPHGIVFSSNRKDWLYRSLRRISGEEAGDIARTQQFGPGPWEWIGMDMGEGNTAIDNTGGKYLAYRMTLEDYPGWSVIYLRSMADITKKISAPLVRATVPITVTLCLLIGMSVFFIYKGASEDIVRRIEAEEALREARKAQDQVRRLSDSILASQERERAAVSRELHDGLGQVLTALHLDTVWLRERLKEADAGASGRAQEMCGLIDMAIDEVRGMATRLRPGVLDNLGLVDALDWYVSDFGKRTGVASAFRHFGVPMAEDRIATSVYRIVQEALTNVIRHSGASRVDVFLKGESGILTLSVEDNGKGFYLRDLSDSVGLGVVGMRERAELIGGTLEIRSEPGGGTVVFMKVPAVVKSEVSA